MNFPKIKYQKGFRLVTDTDRLAKQCKDLALATMFITNLVKTNCEVAIIKFLN